MTRRVVNSGIWSLSDGSVQCVFLPYKYMCCKVLSLGYVSVLGETLSVLLQHLISINVSNPKGVGGITDGIRARSCDHRLRPEPCILM